VGRGGGNNEGRRRVYTIIKRKEKKGGIPEREKGGTFQKEKSLSDKTKRFKI